MTQKKLSFYELNARFFKDYSGDGVGDLTGLANKMDYFDFLGVDAIILQDVLSVDSSKDEKKSFMKIASEIGDINNLKRIITQANKTNKKILIELPLGSITEDHSWFEKILTDEDFKNVVKMYDKKSSDTLEYTFLEKEQKYYVKDEKTQEVPLNWSSEQVIKNFIKVIKFWKEIGVHGFVFKKFEFLKNIEKNESMSIETIKHLRRFYVSIKEIDNNLIVIGKTNLVTAKESINLTKGNKIVFDYFLSEKLSENGTHSKFKYDVIGKFSPFKLSLQLINYGKYSSNIISFDSKRVGRSISRWLDDNQYIDESAKTLLMLSHINKASSSIFYGNEIGLPNIGLTHLDDFQDVDLPNRKRILKTKGIEEVEFIKGQISQGAINARVLMPWADSLNGGFSTNNKTISPVCSQYKDINVKTQFASKLSTLNFTKKLIEIIKNPTNETIIKNGKYFVSSLIPGVVKVSIKYNNSKLVLLANLSDKIKPIVMTHNENQKIILSSYAEKAYKTFPKKLEPYETILIVKGTRGFFESQNKANFIKNTFTKKTSKVEEKLRLLGEKEKAFKDIEKNKELEIGLRVMRKEQEIQKEANMDQTSRDSKQISTELKESNLKELEKIQKESLDKVSTEFESNADIQNMNVVEEKNTVIIKDEFPDLKEDPINPENNSSFEQKPFVDEQEKMPMFDDEEKFDSNLTMETTVDVKIPNSEIEKELIKDVSNLDKVITEDFSPELQEAMKIADADEIVSNYPSDYSNDINKNDDINKVKEEAKIQREIDRSYLDEKTKLTEDEVAKTTLIEDDEDLKELFGEDFYK